MYKRQDKERFNREKLMYRDKVYREARRTMADAENVKIFFKGVNDTDSVKKRYKDLLDVYKRQVYMARDLVMVVELLPL